MCVCVCVCSVDSVCVVTEKSKPYKTVKKELSWPFYGKNSLMIKKILV